MFFQRFRVNRLILDSLKLVKNWNYPLYHLPQNKHISGILKDNSTVTKNADGNVRYNGLYSVINARKLGILFRDISLMQRVLTNFAYLNGEIHIHGHYQILNGRRSQMSFFISCKRVDLGCG